VNSSVQFGPVATREVTIQGAPSRTVGGCVVVPMPYEVVREVTKEVQVEVPFEVEVPVETVVHQPVVVVEKREVPIPYPREVVKLVPFEVEGPVRTEVVVKEVVKRVPFEVEVEVERERVVVKEDKKRIGKMQRRLISQSILIARLRGELEERPTPAPEVARWEVGFLAAYFAVIQFVILIALCV